MPVYREPGGKTWRVVIRGSDWTGKSFQTTKRGFKTKHEAIAWEQKESLQNKHSLTMTFEAFYELYMKSCEARLRENTVRNKKFYFAKLILPYFGQKKMKDISAVDVMNWQTQLLAYRDESGKGYSKTYLRKLHAEVSALFNHAIRYYDLPSNPAVKAGSMGSKRSEREMIIWSKEQYMRFAETQKDNALAYYAFEILFWCGIREGELLALTPSDFDLDKGMLSINKSYQRYDGRDVITPPKTVKSNRKVSMPDFLIEEIRDLIDSYYDIGPNERLFPYTKHFLKNHLQEGARKAGLPQIRVHDFRHSHVSYLIDLNYSPVVIADRVGHESIEVTFRYAHLFEAKRQDIANKLEEDRKDLEECQRKIWIRLAD